ncbi:cytochrome b N-terminal domain-containing protein [Alphaproteobacteria bacterium]|nr:cytochrome b N-terminal domain-containing protein [Alphaproteobacteria bacterium]MDB2435331.1 cytochrome b N-terminal domain-containing protein [Alphaproteobacteria bacterium]MDB4233748.1 cytochrome b N-terminal domain-containing protein [Alphaproteobacteria bacterium]MDC1315851.1 cytochrome b N-terminal domain-containing protein [Alphaproteobacteria bacterium]
MSSNDLHGYKKTLTSPYSGVKGWIDSRLPLIRMMEAEYLKFPVPKSLNYFWSFGGILMFCLIGLILSGIFLGMHYKPSAEDAFNSVERIMRDVQFGWLVRYLHMNLASFFFIAVYIHIFRALYFGSYKAPRELVFIFGMLMFLLMMGTAFLGYTLPWGQMSYWGATVITNLFSAIPVVGDAILLTLLGDFTVSDATVNRFYVLHWLLAFAIVGLVVFHVITLHMTGSNNPSGMEPQNWDETLSFHPYMTIKDTKAMVLFFIVVAFVLFFYPNIMGHSDNYIRANSMVTPAHIVPEWYFLPFYAILRAIPDKLGGVLAMFGAIAVLFLLPWLDTSKVRSCLYRPIWRICVLLFALDFFVLTYMGAKPASDIYVLISRIGTAYWFLFFLVLAPLVGYLETPRQPLTISNFLRDKKALT